MNSETFFKEQLSAKIKDPLELEAAVKIACSRFNERLMELSA